MCRCTAPSSRWPRSRASWKSTGCSTMPCSTRFAPASASRSARSPFNPIQVTHSLVDCVALAIHTPLGILIHTGDFKVDPTPTDNRLFDLHAFAEYGKEGVLALFQDSTNVERRGYTPSERAVRARFEEIFARAERRCSSPASRRRSIASSWRWTRPSRTGARSRWSGAP